MNIRTNTKTLIAYIFLLLTPIMVGINITGAKYLLSSLPILFILSTRFLIATIMLLPWHWLTQDAREKTIVQYMKQLNTKDWIFIVVQAVSAGVLFNFLMVYGLRYTDANAAGIITSALPALIALMSWLVLKEHFTIKKSLCIAFATFGLLVVSFDTGGTAHHQQSLFGNFIVFISLLPETSYYILTKIHPCRLPVFLMSALINGINAIILLPIMLMFVDEHLLHVSLFSCGILLLVGLSSGLFYVFWFLGSKEVDPMMAALTTAIMPVATVTIAWLTLGESISLLQILGMVLVMMSILAYALPLKLSKFVESRGSLSSGVVRRRSYFKPRSSDGGYT